MFFVFMLNGQDGYVYDHYHSSFWKQEKKTIIPLEYIELRLSHDIPLSQVYCVINLKYFIKEGNK